MPEDDNRKSDPYPEAPDMTRVHALRERLRKEKAHSDAESAGPQGRLNRKVGKTARDIGTYTLIPSLMIAGPVVGYALGLGWQHFWGGAPWGVVVGMLLGVVAAFRQVILLLSKKGNK